MALVRSVNNSIISIIRVVAITTARRVFVTNILIWREEKVHASFRSITARHQTATYTVFTRCHELNTYIYIYICLVEWLKRVFIAGLNFASRWLRVFLNSNNNNNNKFGLNLYPTCLRALYLYRLVVVFFYFFERQNRSCFCPRLPKQIR